MTPADIAKAYRNSIADLAYQQRRLAAARAELTQLGHQNCIREAQTVIAGVEGSNEAARKANLTLALEADGDYSAIARRIVEVQADVADADVETTAAREFCRLLRLELALSASDCAKEAALS